MGAANLLQTLPAVSVAARVMAEIHDLKPEVQSVRPARRLMRWLARPRAVTLRLRPAWTLALVAGLAPILLIPTHPTHRPAPGAHEGPAPFSGQFPAAGSVA